MPAIDIEIHSQKMEGARYFSLKSLGERGLLLASISVSVLVYPSPCLPGWRYLLPRRDQRRRALSLSLSLSNANISRSLSRGSFTFAPPRSAAVVVCQNYTRYVPLPRNRGFFPFPFCCGAAAKTDSFIAFRRFFSFSRPFPPQTHEDKEIPATFLARKIKNHKLLLSYKDTGKPGVYVLHFPTTCL